MRYRYQYYNMLVSIFPTRVSKHIHPQAKIFGGSPEETIQVNILKKDMDGQVIYCSLSNFL